MAPDSVQFALGPMQLKTISGVPETSGNRIAGVTLAALLLNASRRVGMQGKELASVLGISESNLTKALSENYPEHNKLMKVELDMGFIRMLALVAAEAAGLTIAGADAERQALGDLLEACSRYIRVVRR